jgi:hypothetical protein
MGLITKAPVPMWVWAFVVGSVPVGTYSWMLYTRPNIYEQIVAEIKRQEEAEKARSAAIRH